MCRNVFFCYYLQLYFFEHSFGTCKSIRWLCYLGKLKWLLIFFVQILWSLLVFPITMWMWVMEFTKTKFLQFSHIPFQYLFEHCVTLLQWITGFLCNTGLSLRLLGQCSPYQAVTGKLFHLKEHFLLPATAWRVTKIK